MNLDVCFGPSPWELALENMDGESLSAVRFLTLMEGEPEDALEEGLLELERRKMMLDVSELPKIGAVGEAALRLRREEQLVQNTAWAESLDESDPLRMYLEELTAIPAGESLEDLSQRLAQGDRSVVEQITNIMLKDVVDCACELTGRGVLLQDLIQEGSLGLWQGILEYTEGNLREQCLWHIRFGMARLVTVQARSNGVGQRMRQAMEDYRMVDERLLAELGRNPTLEEIARQLHMSEEETTAVANMLDAARSLAHVKQPEEPVQEEQEQAVEDTAYFQMRQRITELLSKLSADEADLLTLRFGLEGDKPLSAEEVGEKLGLTREEVVVKEANALAKLRNL